MIKNGLPLVLDTSILSINSVTGFFRKEFIINATILNKTKREIYILQEKLRIWWEQLYNFMLGNLNAYDIPTSYAYLNCLCFLLMILFVFYIFI